MKDIKLGKPFFVTFDRDILMKDAINFLRDAANKLESELILRRKQIDAKRY